MGRHRRVGRPKGSKNKVRVHDCTQHCGHDFSNTFGYFMLLLISCTIAITLLMISFCLFHKYDRLKENPEIKEVTCYDKNSNPMQGVVCTEENDGTGALLGGIVLLIGSGGFFLVSLVSVLNRE